MNVADFLPLTDECMHCDQPIGFDQESESYYGKGWNEVCPVAGMFGHEPEIV